MPNYRTLDTGAAVEADDPNRGIYYGTCGFWTDDWDKIGMNGSIPCCPECKRPGFQTTARNWYDGAEMHNLSFPGYNDFLKQSQGQCFKGKFMEAFEEYKRNGPKQ